MKVILFTIIMAQNAFAMDGKQFCKNMLAWAQKNEMETQAGVIDSVFSDQMELARSKALGIVDQLLKTNALSATRYDQLVTKPLDDILTRLLVLNQERSHKNNAVEQAQFDRTYGHEISELRSQYRLYDLTLISMIEYLSNSDTDGDSALKLYFEIMANVSYQHLKNHSI